MKIIVSHLNQDFDSLASMVAVSKLFPDAILIDPGAIEKNVRNFLKDYPQLISFKKIKNIDLEQVETIILVDTRQPGRTMVPPETFKRSKVIIFDHHPHHEEDIKGAQETIRYYGATITILLNLLERKRILFTPEEATLFALGIFEDTGMLTYSSVTHNDIEALNNLLKNGAAFSAGRKYISYELDQNQMRIYYQLLDNSEVFNFSGINTIVGNAESEEYVDGISLLTHKIMDPGNYKAGFIIVQMKDRVHLIGRSRIAEINVAKILEKFGGGGHPTAASGVIKDLSKFQVKETLVEELKKISNNLFKASEIMEKNILPIQISQTIDQASSIFKKTDKGYLLVFNNSEVIGYITKDDVKRLIKHNLEKKKISDITVNNFSVITGNTKINKIFQKLFSENEILLVEQKGVITGLISKKTIRSFIPEEFSIDPLKLNSGKIRSPITGNAKKLLYKYLPTELNALLNKISEIASKNKFSVYLVGGFVRDILLASFKKKPDKLSRFDFDIVTPQNGIKLANLIAKHFKVKPVSHHKFNTAIIILKKGIIMQNQSFRIDIATARKEKYQFPGALPDVKNAPLRKDLFRRDFTINTIAISLAEKEYGKIFDFFNGQNDMKKGVIRVLHNLSFIDDPTRIFRAFRFSGRLNFRIEDHTERLLKNAITSRYIKNLSGKRVFEELKYIFSERNPVPIIKHLADHGAFYFISPDIIFTEEKEELTLSVFEVLSWFKLLFAENQIEKWIPYLLIMIYDIPPEEKERICKSFYMTKKNTNLFLDIQNNLIKVCSKLSDTEKIVPSVIYNTLHRLPIEAILFLMAYTKDNKLIEKKISLYLIELIHEKIATTGEELIQMGIKNGPEIGDIKNKLLELKLDGKIRSKADEIKYIKKYFLK